jgi:hypothetical protein
MAIHNTGNTTEVVGFRIERVCERLPALRQNVITRTILNECSQLYGIYEYTALGKPPAQIAPLLF